MAATRSRSSFSAVRAAYSFSCTSMSSRSCFCRLRSRLTCAVLSLSARLHAKVNCQRRLVPDGGGVPTGREGAQIAVRVSSASRGEAPRWQDGGKGRQCGTEGWEHSCRGRQRTIRKSPNSRGQSPPAKVTEGAACRKRSALAEDVVLCMQVCQLATLSLLLRVLGEHCTCQLPLLCCPLRRQLVLFPALHAVRVLQQGGAYGTCVNTHRDDKRRQRLLWTCTVNATGSYSCGRVRRAHARGRLQPVDVPPEPALFQG